MNYINACEECEMKISGKSKTKQQVVCTLNNQMLEQLSHNYLGTLFSEDGKLTRIEDVTSSHVTLLHPDLAT